MQLPTTLTLGTCAITLDPDATATLAFLNGFQVGHLAYMVHTRKQELSDIDVVLVICSHQHDRKHSVFFNTGLLLGWCSTLSQKATDMLPIVITQEAFRQGYGEGESAWMLRDTRKQTPHSMSLSELCALVSWSHGPNGASNAGYLVGYIHALSVPRSRPQEGVLSHESNVPG